MLLLTRTSEEFNDAGIRTAWVEIEASHESCHVVQRQVTMHICRLDGSFLLLRTSSRHSRVTRSKESRTCHWTEQIFRVFEKRTACPLYPLVIRCTGAS
jgi:hypothetical protein